MRDEKMPAFSGLFIESGSIELPAALTGFTDS
jgi:hypothetical protein